MSTVRIMLAPSEVSRVFMKDAALVKMHIHQYLVLPPMEVEQTGEDAAEEMFDLTNNPWRQQEREMRYGNGQSLSSGDVVDVDGRKFACLSVGWAEIL